MFYSHEVLTSRKYGVATVWLVATLGSSSKLKKVTRKAILDVDVQKACDTISASAAPMALRLQSNLLYGIARVYSQQCGYMLHDAEVAKTSMRLLLKTMQANTLDALGENSGRSDQLVLQDDPEFFPDFNLLPGDLERMDLEFGLLEESQRTAFSPHDSRHSSVGTASIHDIGGLMIPHSASSLSAGPGPTGFSGRGGSSAGVRTNIGGLDDDLGMGVDEDGNLYFRDEVEHRTPVPAQKDAHTSIKPIGSRVMGQSTINRNDDGYAALLDDDGFMPLQDDEYAPNLGDDENADPHGVPAAADDFQEVHQERSEETATAPVRRRTRAPLRLVPLDDVNATQLHNRDLARWGSDYVANMHDLTHKRTSKDLATQARTNAEVWMLAQGDVGPLRMFTGIRLLEALTGMKMRTAGRKRPRQNVDEFNDERRVRQKSSPLSQEAGRRDVANEHGLLMDDRHLPVMEDDTIEQGREAPTPLEERAGSSIMPWNMSADSRRGTAFFSAGGFPTSNSLGGGMSQHFSGLGHRRSRLTSASPLLGRGAPSADIDDFQLPQQDDNAFMTDANVEDFELYGAAANVDTQTAEQSQWQRAALDGESEHFLDFVQTGIEELDRTRHEDVVPGDEEDETLLRSIEFATLLPPTNHSKIVAAQGLLHVLSLATKTMLVVQQAEAFGAIVLRVPEVA